MAYNVGEVEVSVFPNAEKFNEKLQGQVGPQADRLGKQIGDQLAQQIAQGIRRGLGDFPSDNPAKDPAKRKGDEAAGAFGDAFKARLRAAMADLPDVKIGVDSSAADRALAAVRADMAALADKRIGVDLSDTEALAKLDELKAKLAEIGASSDSARVKVDTAAATAELVKFQAEMDKINGETATAKVKVDGGGLGLAGGINSLVGALGLVAPAIVPIGAAAAAGGMALAAMGAAGIGAAGVLAIAFKGVGDAVKLLGQQQTQQAAADSASAGQASAHAQAVVSAQRQMQSAQMALGDAQRNAAQQQVADAQAVASAQTAVGDAVRAASRQQIADAQAVASAQTGLADARRSAANQEISDEQAVVSAQQSLAQANDQVRLAQLALTAAQEAGRRELESYANNAADAALSQRQAVISLETAQANYTKTLSSGTATQIQREQATLDVAKAQQSLVEANQRVTESAQDNNKAQAAGITGTQAVVSAQKQVTQAQQAQRGATQSLADAQRKQANDQIASQESIAKAAQALADAQRKSADDQVTSRESIAKASQALATAQQKSASDQITSQESIVRAQQGVAAAADAMAAAQQQSSGTTNAALAATNAAIAKLDPATRNFAEYLRGTWAPIWKHVQAAAAGGLLPGVQAGMDALIPVMPQITTLVGNLASTMGDLFKQAGQALASPFWQHFISDIAQAAGPLLTDMAHAIGNVIQGIAGMVDAFLPMDKQIGDGLVGLTQKFSDWGTGLAQSKGFHDFVDYVHQEWPIIKDVIENVATVIGHVIQAGGILGGPTLEILRTFSTLLASLPVPVVAALVAAFEGFKVLQTVAGPLESVTKSLSTMGSNLAGKGGLLGSVGTGLTGIASAAGPAAIGIGAVATISALWIQAGQQAADVALALGKALHEGGNAANEAAAYIQKYQGITNLMDHSAGLADVKLFGTSFRDLIPSAQGATKAYQDWYNGLSPTQKITEDVSAAQQKLNDVLSDPNHTSAQATAAADELAQAQARQKSQTDAVTRATDGANGALERLISTQQTQASATLGLDAAILNTQNQIDNYKAHLNDATMSANDHKLAENQVEQSMLNVVEAAKKKADADNAGKSPAQLAQAEVAAQRDALDKLVAQLGYVPPALKGMYDQLNGPQATALAAAQTQTDSYKQAINDLGAATNGLPYQHGIVVTANTQAARDAITGLTNDYHNYSINVGLGGTSAYAAADGGVLPGWSPGKDIHTFTSPSGGALKLSGGEAVMRPEFTAAVGSGWVNSVNAAARSGGSAGVRSAMGFADGGVIPWNPWSLMAKVGIDPASIAAAEKSFAFTPGGPVALPPGGAVERWRAVVDQVLGMLHQPLVMDNGVLSLIKMESGGNPTAINLTDSNARAGHPSQGLMQTIPTTFRAYAGPFVGRGITDPLANIYAGVNYALQRYGPAMLMAGGRHNASGGYIGYDQGGLVPPGYHMLYNGTGGNEVIAPQQTFQQVVNKMHSDAPGKRDGGAITLQLDREAVTDLLDGRIVSFADGMYHRGEYNG